MSCKSASTILAEDRMHQMGLLQTGARVLACVWLAIPQKGGSDVH